MFCVNCGKQIPDSAKFCAHCGTAQGSTSASAPAQSNPQYQQPQYAPPAAQYSVPQQLAAPKKSGKGLKIGGIILLVLGILSVVGSFANETYFAMLNYGMDGTDAAMLGFQIAMIIGGITMISKSGKR